MTLSEDMKTCFVVMPISDRASYETGHFKRVYEHIIKPACVIAGFLPVRADDESQTNVIIVDILQKVIQSDIVICDLSSKNPNVMYELGIRQAFDLPVVLIKDKKTDRIFDTSMLRDIEYDEGLRVDTVQENISLISTSLKTTYESYKNKTNTINSLIKLLGIMPARLVETQPSPETSFLYERINNLNTRIVDIEGLLVGSNDKTIGLKKQNYERTYEDFFKEQAATINIEGIRILYDDDDKQLMVISKQRRSFVEKFRENIRKYKSLETEAFHIEGKKDQLGIGLNGSNEDIFLGLIVPLEKITIPALNDVISSNKSIHIALVSDDLEEVYGFEIFKEEISKIFLEKKLNYILSS